MNIDTGPSPILNLVRLSRSNAHEISVRTSSIVLNLDSDAVLDSDGSRQRPGMAQNSNEQN